MLKGVFSSHANVLDGLKGLLFRASLLLNEVGESATGLLKHFRKGPMELFIGEVKVPV